MPAAFKILTIRCCFFWSICDFLLIVVPIILVLLNQANFNFPVSLNTLLSTSGWLMAPLSTSPRILGLLKTLLCKASLEFVMMSSINVAVLVYLSLSEKKKKKELDNVSFFLFWFMDLCISHLQNNNNNKKKRSVLLKSLLSSPFLMHCYEKLAQVWLNNTAPSDLCHAASLVSHIVCSILWVSLCYVYLDRIFIFNCFE